MVGTKLILMENITIEELCKKLKGKIDAACDIKEFYIGKAKDVNKRGKKHKEDDDLPYTLTIAHGKENVIKAGEKRLQQLFINDERCLNKQLGGGPTVDSEDHLYISYSRRYVKYKTIHDLDNEDFEWNSVYNLVAKQ